MFECVFESYMSRRTMGRSYQPVKKMEKDMIMDDGEIDRMLGDHGVAISRASSVLSKCYSCGKNGHCNELPIQGFAL